MISEIRIYFECLEQAAHFIKPIIENILIVNEKKIEIKLIKLSASYELYSKLVAPIIYLKNPDILITTIVDNTEYPIFQLEISTAVYTEDHELQRFDGMIAAVENNCIYGKLSPINKISPSTHGGNINFEYLSTYKAIFEKFKRLSFHFNWECDEKGNVLIDSNYLSCPSNQDYFSSFLRELILFVVNHDITKSNWIGDFENKLVENQKFLDWLNSIKEFKLPDLTHLSTSRTEWQDDVKVLFLKINRFGHAMDPERGMLAYYGTVCDNVITKMCFDENNDAWYKDTPKENEINLLIRQKGLKDSYNFLMCFLLGTGLYNNDNFSKVSNSFRLYSDKLIEFDLSEFLSRNFSSLNKSLRTIFKFSRGLKIVDKNEKVQVSISWDIIKNEIDFSKHLLLTPITSNCAFDEDEITYISVHNVLKSNGYKIIAVSYPGAQGDRVLLAEAGSGRRQQRRYIDIISYLPEKHSSLQENKGRFSPSSTKEDIDELIKYKEDQSYVKAFQIFTDKFDNLAPNLLKVGIGFWANEKFTVERITKLSIEKLDYFIFVTSNKSEWKIFKTGASNLFEKMDGNVAIPLYHCVSDKNNQLLLFADIEPVELPKAYSPADVEEKWYSYWLKHNIFHSEIDKNKKPYTIVIPPPNITGSLTMGHILNNTIQDIFIRTKRMQGFNACWVPGTDHASIATESKVVHMLKEKKINKYEIGREEFLKHCWEWKEKYGGIIIQQLKKLGVSCDWQRESFTMDDHYYKKVVEAFVQLYNDGKIYRGFRMVNWDPANKSAISDEEVNYKTVNGKLWYFKYPVKDSDEFITVATTRPETMLGDTGVAVNPNDVRFKKFIGKKVVLPIVGREIPVFADEYVDMEFGTGAVKVTPAHDVNDYDMGQRHKLEIVNILNDDASLNENAPKEFIGLDRFEARKKVVEKIEQLGLLAKVEDYQNKVGYSERGNVPIEPYLSEQWFMSMSAEGGSASGGQGLSEPALQVVKDGKVNYHPDHWVKTYEHWMSNIKDWCISRQLWWGHRIPVWYCAGDDHCKLECKEPIVSVAPPEKCPHCGSTNLRQDEDVLDTWASSWLWAHDVFVSDEEQNYYYPTDLLVTAPDIIFFWVARMIMAGMYFKKDIPFKDVYFTSVIRDVQGRKMSKSLGNSPDPLDVIRDYGSDALRFTVIYLAPLGQDVLFSADKCEFGRNFSNKIWNAGRFLLMNALNIPLNEKLIDEHIDFSDRWINSRFHQTVSEMNKAMDKFEVNNASKIIYSFVWNDFCDWYIELAKNRLYSSEDEIKSAVLTRAIKMFENLLKIVHPFMPFITEELWQKIYERKEGESISTSEYPKLDETKITVEAEKEMEFVQDIITAIRNIRGEMNIPPSKSVKAFIKSASVKDYQLDYIKKLARVEEIQVSETITKPKASASTIIKNCEIYIPLEGLIDLDVEKNRLQKEISRLEGVLAGIDKKLSNEKFVNNAAVEVVEKERTKKADVEANLLKVKEIFDNLK